VHPRWRRRLKRVGLVLGLAVGLPWAAFTIAVRARDYPAAQLEPRRAASLTVLDRQGLILRQEAAQSGGRESWVPIDRISEHLVQATLAAEDHRFFEHGGVDVRALVRAAWLDVRARRLAFGGSTLTMQLVRLLEPRPRGLWAKLGEMVLAGRLERALSKRALLEQYLNRVYYGNGAWGAQAAAQLYFGKPAAMLAPGEAALLAVLPRGPEAYHPYRNLSAALARRAHILRLMVAQGLLSESERALAERTPLALRRERPDFRAPHFVDYALGELPAELRAGTTVRTTLDGPLQQQIEVAAREHLAQVEWLHITQLAVVVLRNSDGAVLALLGSRNYFDADRQGAVSGAVARRRPGSTLKPFVYGLALERGDTPATVALDVVLPSEVHETWTTDIRQHGFARYRESLAGSYNLSAVHTLQRVGVQPLIDRLRRAGLTTLDRPDGRYGPDLAIGEAEVKLIELASGFANFARGGVALRPRAVERVESGGAVVWRPQAEPGPRVFSPQVAWLIWDILRDPDARRPMFGDRVPLELPFAVAAKTGTTRGYTDNWALGATGEFTVGVWAGNFDGTPTHEVMAMRGAAPLLRATMVALAARFGAPSEPARPEGLQEGVVCPLSGQAPGALCPRRKLEWFLEGTVPREPCTWHQMACGSRWVRYPPELQGWARVHGLLAEPACPERRLARAVDGPRILYPVEGARFLIDPDRPAALQVPPLRAAPPGAEVRWTIDGVPPQRFRPSPGLHEVRAEWAGASDRVSIRFE